MSRASASATAGPDRRCYLVRHQYPGRWRDQTLKQDRSYQVINWFSYHPSPNSRIAIGYSHTWGGEQRLDGERNGSKTRVDQWRALYATSVTARDQVQVSLARDLNVQGGFERDYQLNLRLAHVF